MLWAELRNCTVKEFKSNFYYGISSRSQITYKNSKKPFFKPCHILCSKSLLNPSGQNNCRLQQKMILYRNWHKRCSRTELNCRHIFGLQQVTSLNVKQMVPECYKNMSSVRIGAAKICQGVVHKWRHEMLDNFWHIYPNVILFCHKWFIITSQNLWPPPFEAVFSHNLILKTQQGDHQLSVFHTDNTTFSSTCNMHFEFLKQNTVREIGFTINLHLQRKTLNVITG